MAQRRLTRDHTKPIDAAELRIDRSAHPDWPTGGEQPPARGQHVYCLGGMAEVMRILGKTGNGSRLLELRLLDQAAPPFLTAASNVLVAPVATPELANMALPVGKDWLS